MEHDKDNGRNGSLEKRLSEALQWQGDTPSQPAAARVDRAVLAIAEAKARQIRVSRNRRRIIRRVVRIAGAAAAVVLIIVGIQTSVSRMTSGRRQSEASRVDIVDAYLLATKLKAGEHVPEGSDVNADGTIDFRDVDFLARAAVRISTETM